MAAEVITAEHHDATGAAYLSEGDFWGPIVRPGPNIAYSTTATTAIRVMASRTRARSMPVNQPGNGTFLRPLRLNCIPAA